MTKQDTKSNFVDRDLIDIPDDLRKLDPVHVETIRVSIDAKGQIMPILLRPKDGGRFDLADGQHRLAACDALKKQKIKFEITDDATAGDVVNMVRKQFTFSERIKVVTQRPEASDAALASSLGVTERKVKQYRVLSTLPQVIIDAVENDQLSERIAQRATVMPKDMLGELSKALSKGQLPYWADSLEQVRSELEGRRIPTSRALFDIEASGLAYERDLFDKEGGFFHDTKAFVLHQGRAAEIIARKLTDEVTMGVGSPPKAWHEVRRLRQEVNISGLLTTEAKATRTELKKRLAEVGKAINAKKGVYDEALNDENNELVNRIAALGDNPASYNKIKVPGVRVLVWVQNDGDVDFKIYIPEKAKAEVKKQGGPAAQQAISTTPKKPLEAHTKKAWRIARDHRSLALQSAMLQDHLFALRLLLAGLIDGGLFGVKLENDRIQTDVPSHSEMAKTIQKGKHSEDVFEKVWQTVSTMPGTMVMAQLAHFIAPAACMTGYSAERTSENAEDKSWLGALAAAQAIVPALPLPLEYFEAHISAQLLKLITEMKGAKEAALYAGKPRKKLAEAAHSFAVETGWVPKVLAVPGQAKKKPAKSAKPSKKAV